MSEPDDLAPGLKKLLDTLPEPAVRPVDLHAIYAAELRSARRWKRATAAVAALAAGLLLFAVLPKLEVKASRTEVVVRWGPPAEPPVPPPERDEGVALRNRLAAFELGRAEDAARFAAVDRLLADVSADAADRDRQRKRSVDALAKQLTELRTLLTQVRTDNATLYAALFPKKETFP